MREDGTYFDKIVVSTNPSFSPTGTGPTESLRLSDCQIFPSTAIASPRVRDLQTITDITVKSYTCLDGVTHAGWGVKYSLDGGFAGGGSEVTVTTPPYTTVFTSVLMAEHIIDIVVVDDVGTEQTGNDVTDQVTQVGVGDYYVAVGDSITVGVGDDVTSDDASLDGRNSGGGYTPILNDFLTAAKSYPHTVINEGSAGETSAGGLARINSILTRHTSANFYLLKYGMNDARPATPVPSGLGLDPGDTGYAGSFKDNMKQMIDVIEASGSTVSLAKVNIALGDSATGSQYPNPETGARTLNIIQFNLVIDELVTENSLPIVPPDFYTYFLNNNATEYSDNIHPNGIGYDSMSDLWGAQL
jgi:lysophospholipase L1-like esterase